MYLFSFIIWVPINKSFWNQQNADAANIQIYFDHKFRNPTRYSFNVVVILKVSNSFILNNALNRDFPITFMSTPHASSSNELIGFIYITLFIHIYYPIRYQSAVFLL